MIVFLGTFIFSSVCLVVCMLIFIYCVCSSPPSLLLSWWHDVDDVGVVVVGVGISIVVVSRVQVELHQG